MAAQSAALTISCGSNAADLAFCEKYARDWAANGHTIRLYTAPASSTDNLALLRQQLAAKSPDVDVVRIDVVWPGVIKDHLLDLKPYSHGAEARHFPAIVANNTVDGKLLGMPWYTDAGLLYYRKDLLQKYGLQPPATWDDLAASARQVMDAERAAGNADFQGYVFQGQGLRRADLQCARMGAELRRRHRGRWPGRHHDQQPEGGLRPSTRRPPGSAPSRPRVC